MRSPLHRSALLLLVAAAAAGRTTAVLAQTGEDLVTVDVVVLDGKGRPVPGLTRDDFVVTEDGRQPIVTFEAIDVQAAPIAPPADATVASNEAPSAPGRTFAILLDDVWIPARDVPAVRDALTAFLERSFRPEDDVSLASTTGDVQWSARFPEGREDLLAVLARFGGDGPAQEKDALAAAGEVESVRVARMRLTHAALRRELEALARVKGRKSLLLVTQGFVPDTGEQGRETTWMAHESNVAIHVLDARALSPVDAAPPGDAAAGSDDLATDTGGFAVRDTSGLDRITAESRVFYMLGFQPPPGKGPGEWRALRIAVRRPGLTVRARRGYTLPRARGRSGARGPSIPVRLSSYVLEPEEGDKTRVVVAIEIDVRDLPAAPGEVPMRLRVHVVPRSGGAGQSRELFLNRDHALTRAGSPSARVTLALARDVYRVRVEVDEPATGRRGIVEQRVAVSDPIAFRISTPILSDTPMPASAAGAPAPVAHRSFAAAAGPLFYAFSILGAAHDPSSGKTDVRFRLAVKDRSGRVVVDAPDGTVAPASDGRLAQVVSLPVGRMPAGAYDLELAVTDRVGAKTIERTETFVVEPGSATATAERAPSAGLRLNPSVAPGPDAPPVPPDLVPILDRAGRYVLACQETFSGLLADEESEQQLSERAGPSKRQSRADVLVVSLPGPLPWTVFRDVYEVDGKQVRVRDARLEHLVRPDGAASTAPRAEAIQAESASFDLGPVRPTLRVPTLALLVLHPDHRHRFAFARSGTRAIDGILAAQIAFTEQVRPTLVAGDEGDVPSRGTVWVDPERGTVLRTEISYRPDGEDRSTRTRTRVLTEYALEPSLRITVPVRMTETYESGERVGGAGLLDDAGRARSGIAIETVARYSAYRRLDAKADGPPAERP